MLKRMNVFLDGVSSVQFLFPLPHLSLTNAAQAKESALSWRQFATIIGRRDKNRFCPDNIPPSAGYPADIQILGSGLRPLFF